MDDAMGITIIGRVTGYVEKCFNLFPVSAVTFVVILSDIP
jgi:hypothetical protein